METTAICWGYYNLKKMETTIICWGFYNLKENGNYYNGLYKVWAPAKTRFSSRGCALSSWF